MQDTNNAQMEPKLPYSAPELIEHGTVEEITGFDDTFSPSGRRPTFFPGKF
jgi:hypothetical protein